MRRIEDDRVVSRGDRVNATNEILSAENWEWLARKGMRENEALRARVQAAEAERDALRMQVDPLRWAANEMQRKARAAEAALAAMLDTHVCELHDERAKSARTRARALLGATESGPPPT